MCIRDRPAGTGVLATLSFTESSSGYDFSLSNVVLSAADGETEYASGLPSALSVAACPDTDTDTVCDAVDVCAGFDDLSDNDSDGTPDGCDDCDNDPNKVAEGICG